MRKCGLHTYIGKPANYFCFFSKSYIRINSSPLEPFAELPRILAVSKFTNKQVITRPYCAPRQMFTNPHISRQQLPLSYFAFAIMPLKKVPWMEKIKQDCHLEINHRMKQVKVKKRENTQKGGRKLYGNKLRPRKKSEMPPTEHIILKTS